MNRWMRLTVFVVVAALAVVPAFAAGSIRTEITMDSSFLDSTQNVYVNFTMTNEGTRTARVLRWATPFEEIEADLFEVARNGERVPYEGRLVKRPAPQAADYLALRPGDSLSARVELSAFYEMSYGGEYLVRFRSVSYDHAPGAKRSGGERIDLESNLVSFWMEGDEPPVVSVAPWQKAGKPPKGACDNTQQATLANALAAARSISANAVSYLNGSAGPRYTEWFGTFTTSRWNTVGTNFDAISSALDTAPVEFDCGCKQNYYAYVYPNQPYKIYLCSVFWQAPLTGTDSKAGTLVHEISHFNVVAGTDDVTYGQASCRNLAVSDPNAAITNADSHEYFAENTPPLN